MKEIRRSRRLRLPRRRHQLPKSLTSDNDESDLEHIPIEQTSIVRSNKNANRMPTTLVDTITNLPIEDKQHQTLHSSSDQSSLFLYSINSLQKGITLSDDLTPLTTNTTPLTTLTSSNTKQTETATIKIDLTQLTGTDTLDSSSTHQIYDTDTSIKSLTFSKNSRLDQKHVSCLTISDVLPSEIEGVRFPTENIYQPLPIRWNAQNRLTFFIGCSSISLIVGIIILAFIL